MWNKIRDVLGSGLHWSKPRKLYLNAIKQAEDAGDYDVADHIRIILELRDRVGFVEEKEPGTEPG